MSESKRTFVPSGDDPVTLSFGLLGGLSSFEITVTGFSTSDPHVLAELDKYASLGQLKPKESK